MSWKESAGEMKFLLRKNQIERNTKVGKAIYDCTKMVWLY